VSTYLLPYQFHVALKSLDLRLDQICCIVMRLLQVQDLKLLQMKEVSFLCIWLSNLSLEIFYLNFSWIFLSQKRFFVSFKSLKLAQALLDKSLKAFFLPLIFTDHELNFVLSVIEGSFNSSKSLGKLPIKEPLLKECGEHLMLSRASFLF